MKYDLDSQEIAFICWTPLKAGRPSPMFTPGRQTSPPDDLSDSRGTGGRTWVRLHRGTAEGHLLYVAAGGQWPAEVGLDFWRSVPFRLDDVTGTCFCPTTDDAVVEEPDPVFDALKKAQKANQDAQQSKIDAPAAGGAGSSNDKKEKKKGSCDCHDGQCRKLQLHRRCDVRQS